MLVVRYISPDRIDFEEVRLETGELLLIGRAPGEGGIELYEADREISRIAVELSEVADGVRVRNRNRWTHVEFGASGSIGTDLPPGEAHTLAGSGWVLIPDGHLIEFEFFGVEEGDPNDPPSNTTMTCTLRPTGAWEQLYPNYRQTCTALVVAWFIDDFIDIPYQTPASNPQVAVLLGVTLSAANNKLDRTKSRLGRLLDQEFIGEQGKLQIARWVTNSRFVIRSDVEELPGIDRLARRG